MSSVKWVRIQTLIVNIDDNLVLKTLCENNSLVKRRYISPLEIFCLHANINSDLNKLVPLVNLSLSDDLTYACLCIYIYRERCHFISDYRAFSSWWSKGVNNRVHAQFTVIAHLFLNYARVSGRISFV